MKTTIRVNVDLYYEVELPDWACTTGAEKLVAEAFGDFNRPLTLKGLGEICGVGPAEISYNSALVD
jgi:hypothetical protein